MFVWNPQINTGFPSITVLKAKWIFALPTLNTQKQFVEKRQIKRIPSGFPIYINMIWFLVTLFHLLKFDNYRHKISDEQAEKLQVIKAHYNAITLCKNDLQKLMTESDKEFKHEQQLIQTVPVPKFQNEFSDLRVITEIGTDMSKFPTAKHLSSWTGVCPACDESANKKHSTKISKGGTI